MEQETDATDEALMAAVASGASAAMDVLYRRHVGDLRRYFGRFETREAGAEDLVQETFVRVLRYAASFDPARSFRGWLFGIARNVALDGRSAPDTQPVDDAVLSAPDDPEREYRSGEALAALEQALEALGDDDRRVLILGKVEGRSYREIGRLLGVTEGAVKVRVFRALRRLRERLREDGNPGGWLDEQ